MRDLPDLGDDVLVGCLGWIHLEQTDGLPAFRHRGEHPPQAREVSHLVGALGRHDLDRLGSDGLLRRPSVERQYRG